MFAWLRAASICFYSTAVINLASAIWIDVFPMHGKTPLYGWPFLFLDLQYLHSNLACFLWDYIWHYKSIMICTKELLDLTQHSDDSNSVWHGRHQGRNSGINTCMNFNFNEGDFVDVKYVIIRWDRYRTIERWLRMVFVCITIVQSYRIKGCFTVCREMAQKRIYVHLNASDLQ